MPSRRPIRIENVSGATRDAPHAMFWMAQTGNVGVITGDWVSELNIAWNAIIKREDLELVYEVGFLEQLSESIDIIADKIKIGTNAGALNAAALTRKVEELCVSRGLDGAVIASVYGDDVTGQVLRARKDGALSFPYLDREEMLLKDWNLDLAPAVTIHPPPKTASYPVESPSEETSSSGLGSIRCNGASVPWKYCPCTVGRQSERLIRLS